MPVDPNTDATVTLFKMLNASGFGGLPVNPETAASLVTSAMEHQLSPRTATALVEHAAQPSGTGDLAL